MYNERKKYKWKDEKIKIKEMRIEYITFYFIPFLSFFTFLFLFYISFLFFFIATIFFLLLFFNSLFLFFSFSLFFRRIHKITKKRRKWQNNKAKSDKGKESTLNEKIANKMYEQNFWDTPPHLF